MAGEIWTIGKILKWTEGFFKEKGIDTPRLDAEVLLGHLLHKERIYLYVHYDEPLEQKELAAYREMIKQRVARAPVAYIIGHKEFMGLDFKVTRDTLVPRPDTEILVQGVLDALKRLGHGVTNAKAADDAETMANGDTPGAAEAMANGDNPSDDESRAGGDKLNDVEPLSTEDKPRDVAKQSDSKAELPPSFIDIGTGSGAIGLSLLHRLPEAHGATVDISPAARAVAEENAAALGVAERMEFFTGDLFAPVAGRRFTAVVSNPPYIPEGDIAGLEPEVRCHEPLLALKGGTDGLDFYRRLIAEAPAYLYDGGFLALEVGINQAAAIKELGLTGGQFQRCEILKDYAGIDRVVILWL